MRERGGHGAASEEEGKEKRKHRQKKKGQQRGKKERKKKKRNFRGPSTFFSSRSSPLFFFFFLSALFFFLLLRSFFFLFPRVESRASRAFPASACLSSGRGRRGTSFGGRNARHIPQNGPVACPDWTGKRVQKTKKRQPGRQKIVVVCLSTFAPLSSSSIQALLNRNSRVFFLSSPHFSRSRYTTGSGARSKP